MTSVAGMSRIAWPIAFLGTTGLDKFNEFPEFRLEWTANMA